MRQPARWIGLALMVAVAAWLRLADLADRPMHADEANQAVKLGQLLETGDYRFDPRDHHGPTLYYFGLIPAWIRGQSTLAELDETTVRLTPAVAGILGVLFLGVLVGHFAPGAGWIAAGLMAVSPIAVYYSRYFIQETLLCTFFLGALGAHVQWRRSGAWTGAIGSGVGLGLMVATKATAPLFVVLSLVASAVTAWQAPENRSGSAPRTWTRRDLQQGVVLLLTATAVAALFYSSFFRNPEGLRDAVATYITMGERVAGGNAHDKPGFYYLGLLGWQTNGGYVWNQLPSSLLALIGFVLIVSRRPLAGVFAAIFGVGWFVVVSLTPYKTPWIMVHAVPVLAAWSAFGLGTLKRSSGVVRVAAVVLVLGVIVWQLAEVRMMVFRRPADPRNPLAYVHTSPDLLRLRTLAGPAQPGPIFVISPEYWPLPWYLRGRGDVGYWTEVPARCDAGLVLVAPEWAETVWGRLEGEYREGYLGLRPGVVLQTFEQTGVGRTQSDSQRP
jgi:uncharacterized protein (TIGR03663 family)